MINVKKNAQVEDIKSTDKFVLRANNIQGLLLSPFIAVIRNYLRKLSKNKKMNY